MSFVQKLRAGKLTVWPAGTISTSEEWHKLCVRIPDGARVAIDTEGSPSPFCLFICFLDADSCMVYASVAVQQDTPLSALDLKFQAGVGWKFRHAGASETGIAYTFIKDGRSYEMDFEAGAKSESTGETLICVGRIATTEQLRALLRGEEVSFALGSRSIQAILLEEDRLLAAPVEKARIRCTCNIWHLYEDSNPGYQNTTLEHIVTGKLMPVEITEANLEDGAFFALELADLTNHKQNYAVAPTGLRLSRDRSSTRRVSPLSFGRHIQSASTCYSVY